MRLSAAVAAGLLVAVLSLAWKLGYSGTDLLVGMLALAVLVACAYLFWHAQPHHLFTLAILLAPFAGNWPQLGVPGPLSPDRIVLALALLSVIIRGAGMADRPALRLNAVHGLLAVVGLYAIVSAVTAGTLTQKVPGLKLLEAFGIFPFLAFALAPVAFPTARERSTLLKALVGLGAYLSLTTLFEMAGPSSLVFPRYILNPHYGIHYGRGRGPFVDAVANGFALYACAVACVIAIRLWRSRAWRIFAGAVAVLCVVGTMLTLERSIWIGVVAATIVVLIVVPRIRRVGVPMIVIAVVASGCALVLVPGLSGLVEARAGDQLSVWDRENLEQTALNMIRARPLLGFGWGRYLRDAQPYFQQDPNVPLVGTSDELSNYVLGYAVELGLVGAVLWILAVLFGVGGALVSRGPPDLEPWRAGLLAIFVLFVVVEGSVPPTAFTNLTLWLWAGIVWTARYSSSPAAGRSRALVPLPT